MKLFLNNKLIPAQEAMVSIFDHGFLYGIGLFETFRTYGGKPFLLTKHLQRITESCKQLGISYTPDESSLRVQIAQLLEENGLTEAYFRLTVSAGQGELGLPQSDYTEPTVVLMAKSLPHAKSLEQWRKGKPVVCLKTRRNTPEADIRFKSLHYMNNVLAKRELRLDFADYFATAEGLMLNEAGYLTEGIVSNVFFRKGNTVYTPHISTGLLPGITRDFVITLCSQNDIEVMEGYYDFESLFTADEVWLTNSIQEIVPVTTIVTEQGALFKVSNGEAGEFATQLYQKYMAYDQDRSE